jgi:hypothetical protein
VKREGVKKMRKKIVESVIAGVLVLIFGVASTPAGAQLSLRVLGGHYNLHLGKMNEDFDEHWNNQWGTDFEFKAGAIYGLALGYDVSPRLEIRLEGHNLESKTGDTYYNSWEGSQGFWQHYHHDEFKLTVTPVIFSGIYKLSPFYVGAGVGSFSTKLQWVGEYDEYLNGSRWNSYSLGMSDRDSPAGLVFLAGFSFGGKLVSLNLEASYVMLAKAKLKVDWWDTWDTEVDLGGLQLGLLAGVTFT